LTCPYSRAQTEQAISENNKLYAEAKRFLDAKDYATALNLMEKGTDAGHLANPALGS
jgi:outer membrane protein assembly factor BamD (BamD/ComL family)